jgi:hypothetical protein
MLRRHLLDLPLGPSDRGEIFISDRTVTVIVVFTCRLEVLP